MVSINQEYSSESKYLKATDIGTRIVRVTITHVARETVGSDARLVCYFHKATKGLVLNRTNARTIADAFGDETDNWTGAEIELMSMKVPYEKKMVDGIRIRIPEQSKSPPPSRQGKVEFVANARDDARLRQGQAPQAAPPPPPFDDEQGDQIPF